MAHTGLLRFGTSTAARDKVLNNTVSGGVTGAKAGTLAVMVSCPTPTYQALQPVLKTFGKDMVAYPHGLHVDADGNVWNAYTGCCIVRTDPRTGAFDTSSADAWSEISCGATPAPWRSSRQHPPSSAGQARSRGR